LVALGRSEQTALERQDLPCMYLAYDASDSITSITGNCIAQDNTINYFTLMHGEANGQPVRLESVATLRTDWAPPPGDWPTATAPAANTPAPSLPLSDLGKMSVCATPVKQHAFDHNQTWERCHTYKKDQEYHIQPTQDKTHMPLQCYHCAQHI